jgi:hypothetical protein
MSCVRPLSVVYCRQPHERARAGLRLGAAVAEGTGSEATAKWAVRGPARTEPDVVRADHARPEKLVPGRNDATVAA